MTELAESPRLVMSLPSPGGTAELKRIPAACLLQENKPARSPSDQ